MINIAIFASGRGTNAAKLIQKSKELKNINILLLVTDKTDSLIPQIGDKENIKTLIIPKNGNSSKYNHENKIIDSLKPFNIDWIFLAGYMRILSSHFIDQFYGPELNHSKIINIHPSLLPKYKGLNALERAYQDGKDYAGITTHFVNNEVDSGKIILQQKFSRLSDDSFEDFQLKAKKVEHEIFPRTLELISKNKLTHKEL